jgi:rod shape-determining protein MreC
MMIGLVVVSFLTMTFDVQTSGQGLTGTIRSGAQRLFSPLQALATTVVDPVVDFVDSVSNLAGLRNENETLRREIELLQDQLARTEVDRSELEALQALLALQLVDETLVSTPARVIAGGDAFDLAFKIDKGTEQGVLVGNPVVDDQSRLIGTVIESFATTAVVAPVTDPQVDVPIVTASGMRGLLEGAGQSLRLTIFDAELPVLQDELVLTAGSGRYPPDLPIARVAESTLPEVGTRVIRASANLLGDLDRLKFVIVIQWPVAEEPVPVTTTTTTTPEEEEAQTDSGDGG